MLRQVHYVMFFNYFLSCQIMNWFILQSMKPLRFGIITIFIQYVLLTIGSIHWQVNPMAERRGGESGLRPPLSKYKFLFTRYAHHTCPSPSVDPSLLSLSFAQFDHTEAKPIGSCRSMQVLCHSSLFPRHAAAAVPLPGALNLLHATP